MKLPLIASMSIYCVSLLAQPPFLRKDFPIGDRPQGVLAGDFNGDGRLDLAVRSWACALPGGCGSSSPVFSIVSVLLNSGNGNFEPPIDTRVELHVPFLLTVAADFNGDGKLDLAGSDGGNFAYFLPGRGNGTFLPPREIGTGIAFISATGDFDGDRIPDLLVMRQTGGSPPPQFSPPSLSLEVLFGNGAGFFQAGARIDILPQNANPSGMRVADFDGDGRSDLALLDPSESQSSLTIFLSQADGTFRAPVQTTIDAGDWVLADFNRDGRTDIASAAGVLIGKGDGTFLPLRPYSSAGAPLAVADFTGDGQLDLAFSSSGGFSVLAGRGDGTFLTPVEYRTPWPGGTQAIDLDGDRRADLVNITDNAISLLLFRTQDEPVLRRAVSTASGRAIVAPGSLATLRVSTSATATEQAREVPWPVQLGGVRLEVRDSAGVTRPASLELVSPTQINFLVPEGTALGEAALVIVSDRGTTPAGGMQVDAVAPALLIAFPPGDYEGFSTGLPIPAYTGFRVTSDGVQTPLPNSNGVIPLRPGGEAVHLSFYGTGFRGANHVNVVCTINGVPVPVEYAGPHGMPGLDKIDVRLVPEVRGQPPIGIGNVMISIDGVVANFAALFFN